MNRALRRKLSTTIVVLGLVGGTSLLSGCEKKVQDEFRAAAATSLQQGFNAILTGIVDGVFAVIEPDETTTETPAG